MKKGVFALCVCALSLGMAASASAQTCMGFASISKDQMFQAGMGYAHFVGANSVFGDASVGNDQFFGNATIGHNAYTGSGTGFFNITGGGQLNVKKMQKEWGVCPDAEFQLEWGSGAKRLYYFGGVTVGGKVFSANKIDFVPTVGIQFGQSRVKGVANSADAYGILTFGLGFVMQHGITIRPALTQTFALANGQSTGFLLDLRYAFGSK